MLAAILLVLILIFSAILHEVMHGIAADKLGDPTARYAGRLTLNPIPHLDPFGSVILPIIFALSGSAFFFAWAKPVPYNPYNLRPGRFSEAIVAGAGPFINLVIALVFGALIRLHIYTSANQVFLLIVLINVMLCLFNLIPIPPLDGSKVLEALIPRSWQWDYAHWRRNMEHNPLIGMGLVLLLVIVFGEMYSSIIYGIARMIAGM